MNNVNLVGRLAKDPVARDTGETRVTELILVTERPVIRDGKVQAGNRGLARAGPGFSQAAQLQRHGRGTRPGARPAIRPMRQRRRSIPGRA